MHVLLIGIAVTASFIIVPLIAKNLVENMRNEHENMEWLNQDGIRVLAVVTNVQTRQDWKYIEGWYRDPWDGTAKQKKTWQTCYEVTAQWIDPQTKQVYRFCSEAWSDDVTGKPIEGSAVQVIVDPHNLSRYVIDFQSLSNPFMGNRGSVGELL